jgi:hypothetical protein
MVLENFFLAISGLVDRTIEENGRIIVKKITFQTAPKKVPRTIFEAPSRIWQSCSALASN